MSTPFCSTKHNIPKIFSIFEILLLLQAVGLYHCRSKKSLLLRKSLVKLNFYLCCSVALKKWHQLWVNSTHQLQFPGRRLECIKPRPNEKSIQEYFLEEKPKFKKMS